MKASIVVLVASPLTLPAMARALGVVALVLAAPACSVFSGVSDLQGGAARDAGDAGSEAIDAEVRDASQATADSAVVVPPGDGVTCGNTRCAAGVACCVDMGLRSASCDPGSGCGGAAVPMLCASANDCPHGECCFSVMGGAACARKCDGAGQSALCDPNETDPCSDGKSCRPEPIIPGYFTCH